MVQTIIKDENLISHFSLSLIHAHLVQKSENKFNLWQLM